MNVRSTPVRPMRPAFVAVSMLVLLASLWIAGTLPAQPATGTTAAVMPVFDAGGRLEMPLGWERWMLAGVSLGLSYSEGAGGSEMFHETLIEPSAYEHFRRTGTFRDGTMLALLMHQTGTSALPQRQGRFAGPVMAVEIAVKSARFDGGWGYFGFNPRRPVAGTAFRDQSCAACHAEHGRHDNVFLQFYPLLAAQAPAGSPAAVAMLASADGEARPAAMDAPHADPGAPLALRGLDPVMLVEGREDEGKPEIVMVHDGFEYRFVSEPNRKAFEDDPERYTFRNDTCVMVPGAPIDGGLFALHEGRIYGFASQTCVDDFAADPAAAVEGWLEGSAMDDAG